MPPERGCAYALEGHHYPCGRYRRCDLGALHKSSRLELQLQGGFSVIYLIVNLYEGQTVCLLRTKRSVSSRGVF